MTTTSDEQRIYDQAIRELKLEGQPIRGAMVQVLHRHIAKIKVSPRSTVKPFEEVLPGDVGKDYGDESGTVIAKGTYEALKRYDSTGACDELEPEERDRLVAVQSDGETLLYVYGADGFCVRAN